MKLKLTTSFRLQANATDRPAIDCERHAALPVRTLDRAAAVAFHRNPDATHCIVSTQGADDAVSIRRDSRDASDWDALREGAMELRPHPGPQERAMREASPLETRARNGVRAGRS